MEKKKRCSKTSPRQYDLMFDFFTRNPEMVMGKISSTFTEIKRKKLWESLTVILNSDGSGPQKTSQKWRKTWSDLKSDVKLKLVERRRAIATTGDGPPVAELTSLQEKFATLVESVLIEGDFEAVDIGRDIQIESTLAGELGTSQPVAMEFDPPAASSSCSLGQIVIGEAMTCTDIKNEPNMILERHGVPAISVLEALSQENVSLPTAGETESLTQQISVSIKSEPNIVLEHQEVSAISMLASSQEDVSLPTVGGTESPTPQISGPIRSEPDILERHGAPVICMLEAVPRENESLPSAGETEYLAPQISVPPARRLHRKKHRAIEPVDKYFKQLIEMEERKAIALEKIAARMEATMTEKIRIEKERNEIFKIIATKISGFPL